MSLTENICTMRHVPPPTSAYRPAAFTRATVVTCSLLVVLHPPSLCAGGLFDVLR